MNVGQLTTLVILLLEVALPMLLVLVCLRPRPRSRLEWACRTILILGYLASLCVIVPVFFLGAWWRILLGLALVAAAFGSYARIAPGVIGWWRVVGAALFAVAGLALVGLAARVVAVGYLCPPEWIDLHSPFRGGTWCVANGGSSLLINSHNVPNQIYGMDIVKVNALGKVSNGLLPVSDRLEDYATFGAELYSPCDGVILYVDDGNDDLPPGQLPPRNTAGNLILLGHGRYKILMGHLKKGSLRVREGEAVTQGQLLAQCGNSGHATFPHLHISFATGGPAKAPYSGLGVAAKFDGRFLVRNSFLHAAAAN